MKQNVNVAVGQATDSEEADNPFLCVGFQPGEFEVDEHGDAVTDEMGNVVLLFPDDDQEFYLDRDELRSKPEPAEISDGEEYNDALVLGEETEKQAALKQQPATLLIGEMWGAKDRRNTQDGKWQSVTMSWGDWIAGHDGPKAFGFSRHPIGKKKEGSSIVLGSSIGGARKANAMDEMFALGLDIDSGAAIEDVAKKIRDKNLFALIYTSHSHGKSGLEIKRDEVMRKLQVSEDPSLPQIQEYLRIHSKSRYEESFIGGIRIEDGRKQTKEGVKIALTTPPLDKYRIIFPFEAPVKLIDLAPTQAAALEVWEDKITGMAWAELGIHFDVSATDPSRLFFTARHREDAEWDCLILNGDPLKFEDVPVYKKHTYTKHRDTLNVFELAGEVENEIATPQVTTESGFILTDWHRHAKDRFQLATLLEDTCADKIRIAGGEAQGHVHVECPFEHEHSKEGGTATMAVDAIDSQSGFWTMWCKHDACQGRHKLHFLKEMLDLGWFEEEELKDEDGLYLLPPGEEVTVPESNVDNDEIEAECSKFDKTSKSREIRKMLAGLIEKGIDGTDQGRVTNMLAENTVLGKPGIKKLWKEAFEAQSKIEADKRRIQRANKVMPDLVSLDAATILTVNAAAENSKWLPGNTVYRGGWFGEVDNDNKFHRNCRAFEVVYCADGDSGSGRTNEITIRYPHRSGRLGIVESTYSLGETYRDSGTILGRIADEGLETYPQVKSENLVTLLRAARGREAILVESSGWNEDRTAFVVPTGEVVTDDDQTYILPKKLHVSAKKAGSLDLWVENVAIALKGRNAKYFLTGLLTGVVGCIAQFLDSDMSVILNNEGTSNRGKSTAVKSAVSVWTITTSEGLLIKGDVTETSLEMVSVKATGAVLGVGEEGTSTMSLDKRQAMFLKMAEGQGRLRGKSDGGVRDVATWNTAYSMSTELGFVRSMEKAMALDPSLQLKTGAVSRIISINYDNAVVLDKSTDAAELAAYKVLTGGKKGEEAQERAYGWAGPVFARKLLELGVDAVSARVSKLEAEWGKNRSGAEMRVVGTMALFGIGAEIAKEAGLIPEDFESGSMLKEHLEDTLAQRAHHLNTERQATDALRAGIKKALNKGEIVDADGGEKLRGQQTLAYFKELKKAATYTEDEILNARTYIIPVDRLPILGVNMDIDALVDQIKGGGDGYWDAAAEKARGDWGGVVAPVGKKFGKQGLHESVPTEGKAKNLRITGAWVHGSDDPAKTAPTDPGEDCADR